MASLVRCARIDLLISAPYITHEGTDLVTSNLSESIRKEGQISVLTDLSPLNVTQGSTDPSALNSLAAQVPRFKVHHLPRLHAKVYIADGDLAIVTSGNLTNGGLNANYEYGVAISDPQIVKAARADIVAYSGLGATISTESLREYCEVAEQVRATFQKQRLAVAKPLRLEYEEILRRAEDELIKLRLAKGPIHTVFAKTILYLLKNYGSLSTERLHTLIEAIHPDLCDNTVDRVIDGKRFGKKWKHAVRSAQQHLKRKGLIVLQGDTWVLAANRT